LKVARIQLDGVAPVAAMVRGDALHPLEADVGALIAGSPAGAEQPAVDRATLLPPVVPGKIVAIGLNYQDHIRESGQAPPEVPLVFAKFPTSVVADGVPIRLPRALTERVDWEVELAVIIGRRAHDVAVEDALDHVFGYTIGNDVSARDLQFSDGQWVRAKSLDTFCPLGPLLVTADEIPDPQALRLVCRVNGEVMQDATTGLMVFGVAELISRLSRAFTLDPGDVIATGTPPGVGWARDPKRLLLDGETVAVEIEGIGVLENRTVVDG